MAARSGGRPVAVPDAPAWPTLVCSGSTTTCTRPVASRRSKKTTPPWSRRAATQPASVTSFPASAARTVPAPWVRMLVDASLTIASFIRVTCPSARRATRPARSRGTSTCSPVVRSFTATASRASSSRPTITAMPAPDRSAAFHCAFTDRPPYARSTANPSVRNASTSPPTVVPPSPPRPSTTKTSTLVAGAGTPLASSASTMRSSPLPNPMPGVGGPPISWARPS